MIVACIGLLAWLSFLGSEPGGIVFWGYFGLVAFCSCLTFSFASGYRFWKWIALTVSIFAVAVYAVFDRYEQAWTKFSDGREAMLAEWLGKQQGRRTVYRDTYARWSGRLLYRRFTITDGDSYLGEIEAQGPMAGSGSPYGEWEYTFWKPSYRTEKRWYWYGEQVSEGEWQLRDRGLGSSR